MELTKEQKEQVIHDQLLQIAKAYYGLQITAKAYRDSGDPNTADAAAKEMEKLLQREKSLLTQLAELG